MARAGRKDRGLFSKKDAAGRLRWFVRLWHEGKPRQIGSHNTKTEAREFYEKAKQEQKLGLFFPERYQRCGFAKLDEVLKEYLAGFTGKTKRDEIRFSRKWASLFPGAGLNVLTPAALGDGLCLECLLLKCTEDQTRFLVQPDVLHPSCFRVRQRNQPACEIDIRPA